MALAGSEHINVVWGRFHLFGEQEPEVPQGASKTRRWELGFTAHFMGSDGSTLSPSYQLGDTGGWKPPLQSFAIPFLTLVKTPL